jgi:hypothetical protein
MKISGSTVQLSFSHLGGGLVAKDGPLRWFTIAGAVNNPSRGKDDKNSLCDYLNPAATRQFLEFTHEQYAKYVGAEFGKTILGFRGDEPDFAYTPWTPALPEKFELRKGYDVRPYLASFFAPQLTEEVRRVKADYWDVWSDLFSENFFRVQADWCAAHNLEYLVHLNHEDQMIGLVRSEGDFFKSLSGTEYRTILIPNAGVISQTALNRLQAFAKAGGRVVFLGRTPNLVSEKSFLKATQLGQCRWAVSEPSGELTQQVMAAFPEPDVVFNRPAAAVKYLHRRWSDADMYFFFNESDQKQSLQATLAGTGPIYIWDATQGTISKLAGVVSKAKTPQMPLELAPFESKFIVIGPTR